MDTPTGYFVFAPCPRLSSLLAFFMTPKNISLENIHIFVKIISDN